MQYIQKLVQLCKMGKTCGIYSACTANRYVIKAVLQKALLAGIPALVEATANQVNQNGGYTGMTPVDFRDYVYTLADEVGLDRAQVILGGDHLGPLTWVHLSNEEAMRNAEELICDYVLAGFTKIHIDTSMRLLEDDRSHPLETQLIAERGARLCRIAEDSFRRLQQVNPSATAPLYVIGSEVPIPGGAQENESSVHVTRPQDCWKTLSSFKEAFLKNGLEDAWSRVIGIVVQPGVEFGDKQVFIYDREAAAELTASIKEQPIIFEGHSTDYQPRTALRQMIEDGVMILKVGPALTFALREALFSLEAIERELLEGSGVWLSDFAGTLERAMLEEPRQWQRHYHGNGVETRQMRRYSYSDRSRYYLNNEMVVASIKRLLRNLDAVEIPLCMVSQYLPLQFGRCLSGKLPVKAEALLCDKVGDMIDDYLYAMDPALLEKVH